MVNSNNFVTKFEEGKTYVFSLERFKKSFAGYYSHEEDDEWALAIEGCLVEPINEYTGMCNGHCFNVSCTWCIELTPQQQIEFGVMYGEEEM